MRRTQSKDWTKAGLLEPVSSRLPQQPAEGRGREVKSPGVTGTRTGDGTAAGGATTQGDGGRVVVHIAEQTAEIVGVAMIEVANLGIPVK